MKKYEFLISKNNHTKKLIIKAHTRFEAQSRILKQGFKILEFKELSKTNYYSRNLNKEISHIFKELSLLLEVGLSIEQALNELCKHKYNKNIDAFLNKVRGNIASGQSLHKALENSSVHITQSDLALIKMGENMGDLAFVFAKISEIHEKKLITKKRLKKALNYPIIVLVALFIAFLSLMLFVVPQFKTIFDDFNVNLPLITQIILGLYEFLDSYYMILIPSLLSTFIGFFTIYKYNANFAYKSDRFILKIPIIGKIIFYTQAYYFFLILGLLLRVGIDASKALNLACMGVENKFLSQEYKQIDDLCKQGLEFDEAFNKTKLFEGMIVQMLSVAMKSSKLDFMCEKIALYYQNKQENLVEKFFIFLEPALTLMVAIMVLLLALGIFLPMWELSTFANF
ncbi:type II secretion system F family protein [Campylobacter sp. CCS1377]|uniref:Type II secretion system F family protein n=1 Tax=Campylobacter sp. CCS1377 TaxID=3158229 RepID=A0AAU7E7N2_9BACT